MIVKLVIQLKLTKLSWYRGSKRNWRTPSYIEIGNSRNWDGNTASTRATLLGEKLTASSGVKPTNQTIYPALPHSFSKPQSRARRDCLPIKATNSHQNMQAGIQKGRDQVWSSRWTLPVPIERKQKYTISLCCPKKQAKMPVTLIMSGLLRSPHPWVLGSCGRHACRAAWLHEKPCQLWCQP